MIQPLDMRSVLMLGALVILTLAGIMIYFSLARKTYPGFHCWTAGLVSIGVGGALLTFRGILPDAMTIPLANAMVAAMPFMLTCGLKSFVGRKWNLTLFDLAVCAAFISIFIWATFISPNIFIRAMCLSLVMALYFSQALYIALRFLPSVLGEKNWLLIGMLSFSILSMLVRIAMTLQEKNTFTHLMSSGAGQITAIVMTILSVTGIMCSLLILNTHRMENDLRKANKRIESLANEDPLTSLYNRRYFDAKLDQEFQRLQRSQQPISMIMADIDHFKDYNDAYGHQAGDDCLRVIADIFKKAGGRVSDMAVRFGGEEFAMVLPNTDERGATMVARMIQRYVKKMAIRHEASGVADIITLSIGVASVVPDQSMSPDALIGLTDRAMYESKRNGRNQIRISALEPKSA